MEPQLKPAATWRDALPVLRAAIKRGKLDPTLQYRQFAKQISSATRSLMRRFSGVPDAAAEALLKMQSAQEIVLPEVEGGRPRWSPRWRKVSPSADGRAQAQVEERMRQSLTKRLAAGERVTAAGLRSSYKNQHWIAKGNPDELTEKIDEALWQEQLAGNLWRPPISQSPKVMVLFSGGQSGTAPAELLGMQCVNYELEERYVLNESEAATVTRSTDLTAAPYEEMIPWCAAREGVLESEVRSVTVGQPCHTQTVLDHTLRGSRDCNFRTKGGKPRPDEGRRMSAQAKEKRAEAQKEDRLAGNVMVSLQKWLRRWALRGIQRWYWVENGRWGHLRNQPYMQIWGQPLTCSYCMYRVMLSRQEVYPSEKPTGVWTNIPAQLKQCPHTGWHKKHPGTIGGDCRRRIQLQTLDPYPSKRWTPQELQLDLHLATLTLEDRQQTQAAVDSLWRK